jgi:glycine cleavage system T protein (aminomethyltransferase)
MPDSASVLQPPRASKILRPGLAALTPGVERYRVKGRGSTVVKVGVGDVVTFRDVEGSQFCEVSFVDANGRFNATGLGAPFTRPALGLQDILSNQS